MTNEPNTPQGKVLRFWLEIVEQAAYRKELIDALPDREPVWTTFWLRPEKNGSVSVHVAHGAAQGLRVGTIGNRNLERLKVAMDGLPAMIKGLIYWTNDTPAVKFVPKFAKLIPRHSLR